MEPGDLHYVLSSWLKSYAELARRRRVFDREKRVEVDPGGEFQGLARSHFFPLYEPVVQRLVARSTIAIATLPDVADSVLGWMAIEGDVLHYVHVKPRWRKLGLARWLLGQLDGMPVTYTHTAKPDLLAKVPASWSYDGMRRFERKAAA